MFQSFQREKKWNSGATLLYGLQPQRKTTRRHLTHGIASPRMPTQGCYESESTQQQQVAPDLRWGFIPMTLMNCCPHDLELDCGLVCLLPRPPAQAPQSPPSNDKDPVTTDPTFKEGEPQLPGGVRPCQKIPQRVGSGAGGQEEVLNAATRALSWMCGYSVGPWQALLCGHQARLCGCGVGPWRALPLGHEARCVGVVWGITGVHVERTKEASCEERTPAAQCTSRPKARSSDTNMHLCCVLGSYRRGNPPGDGERKGSERQ
ncbi:uncharacterized protein LOC126062402 [Elephas maximus indicus]|uniref:uncharacterized protein LOC126062402 n=1 Tax=Elephas maximus indicus TaxID=99487 RepID=UPI00211656B3|nr:uncharacterized protein LOC126062402 [Elephas maximus indicus]